MLGECQSQVPKLGNKALKQDLPNRLPMVLQFQCSCRYTHMHTISSGEAHKNVHFQPPTPCKLYPRSMDLLVECLKIWSWLKKKLRAPEGTIQQVLLDSNWQSWCKEKPVRTETTQRFPGGATMQREGEQEDSHWRRIWGGAPASRWFLSASWQGISGSQDSKGQQWFRAL